MALFPREVWYVDNCQWIRGLYPELLTNRHMAHALLCLQNRKRAIQSAQIVDFGQFTADSQSRLTS